MKPIVRSAMVLLATFQLAGPPVLRAQISPAAAKATGPRAQFSEMAFDFGPIPSAGAQRHDFVVTNAGAELLVISNVAPGCGCTTAGAWDREIPPGKTGRIPIEFNPANFSGAISKSVVVTCNDPARPTQILEIRATILRPFEVSPASTSFLPIEGEPRTETKIVRILNTTDQPATLEPPQSANPQFKTELKTIRPGREFELHISYDSANPSAALNTAITLKTSRPDQPILNVLAFVMQQPAVAVIPPTIQLPPGPLPRDFVYHVGIRNHASAALQVTEPAASVEGLVVKVIEQQAGRMFYVTVAIPSDFKVPAGQPAVISVKTSHPRFPEIRVPILPPVPPPAPPVTAPLTAR